MLDSFFLYGNPPANAQTGEYLLPLVILSYAVASFASYTALSLAQQLVTATNVRERRLLHWGGAFAMGAGIWSMHFIGMLSFKMLMVVEYDPLVTLLSMIIAIVVAYGALGIVAGPRLTLRDIIWGAVLMGTGICGMHYMGMAAMEMRGDLRYIPDIFALSFFIAFAASAAALWMAFTLARQAGWYSYLYRIGAALIMGAAICGMHYTGMLAAVFVPWADCRFDPNQDFSALALSIAGITVVILGLALTAGVYRKAQTEIRLQNSEQKLRTLIDNALDAVIAMDERGLVTEWNKQAEAVFGWTRAEALGKKLSGLIIPPAYRDAHEKGMQSFMTDGSAPILNRRIEMTALGRDRGEFPVELAVSAQKLHDGSFQFTAFLRDITERKQAEKRMTRYMRELERSNQELDDFAYIASHDLKEPLRGLHNHASFLIEDYSKTLGEEGAARLRRLSQLAQRMENLVSDLLYFSRLGRIDLAVQETDPNEIVAEIQQMSESFLKERHARIVIPQPMPKITCDKPRITEVFRNLIINAAKYSDKPERIVEVGFRDRVDTLQGPERNVFYVRDNGVGIDRRFHNEIFRIFRRLIQPPGEKEAGTGAGLTFVKKIIERHGGRVWVESKPGEGSTFYFNVDRQGNDNDRTFH
jgi:PAS domain S-box-containing protein